MGEEEYSISNRTIFKGRGEKRNIQFAILIIIVIPIYGRLVEPAQAEGGANGVAMSRITRKGKSFDRLSGMKNKEKSIHHGFLSALCGEMGQQDRVNNPG